MSTTNSAPETTEQLIARLTAENAQLKAAKQKKLSLGVSEKRAVSLYGVRRFPLTFYKQEWTAILGMAEEIKAFLVANDAKLSNGKGE